MQKLLKLVACINWQHIDRCQYPNNIPNPHHTTPIIYALLWIKLIKCAMDIYWTLSKPLQTCISHLDPLHTMFWKQWYLALQIQGMSNTQNLHTICSSLRSWIFVPIYLYNIFSHIINNTYAKPWISSLSHDQKLSLQSFLFFLSFSPPGSCHITYLLFLLPKFIDAYFFKIKLKLVIFLKPPKLISGITHCLSECFQFNSTTKLHKL